MKPISGVPKKKRLQFHILRRCPKYRLSASFSSALPSTPSPAVPPIERPSLSDMPTSRLSQPVASETRQTKRPMPVTCKKKIGTCKHVIAFGDHYDEKAWEIYTKYINSQHALTELPEEV